MLPARPAEAGQHIAGDVVAALDRDLPHGLGHVLDGDGDEALGDLLRGHGLAGRRFDLRRHRLEAARHGLGVQRLVGVRPEHLGEELRPQLAQHDVAVGDRQRPAPTIGRRSRHRAGRGRADPQPRPVERTDRPAARRHGVDVHHRRTHPHAGHHRLEGPLVLAGIVADVGRGAAHVEADDALEPGLARRPRHADHATGRTGQDGVLTPERSRIGQATVRLHEEEPGVVAQRIRDLVHIAAQDRREVGVDHRRVASPDQLHQRADLVADRDLGEADLARDGRDPRLVVGEAEAVQQHDGDGAEAFVERRLQARPRGGLVQRPQHGPLDTHPLVDLDDAVVEGFRLDDVALEQLGPRLVADPQGVGVARRDRQHRRLALALEERVGGHRGAHLHRVDSGALGQQRPDARHGGVGIVLGIFRQQLVGDQRAVRPPRHDVGERTAAVDPEFPAARVLSHEGRNSLLRPS